MTLCSLRGECRLTKVKSVWKKTELGKMPEKSGMR